MRSNKILCRLTAVTRAVVELSPRVALATGGLLVFVGICPLLHAESEPLAPAVMRVEEDWEAVFNEPDGDVDAPQFHTIISPFADLDYFYLQVCWNYREQPEFVAGGLQLLAWEGEWPVGKKSYREDKLSAVAETITWTQAMQIRGSVLTFEVKDGSSTTWGLFGGPETSLSGTAGVSQLNGYTTDASVSNSWISYGANRVDVLRIKEVRRYDADGNLISRDQTPKIVYELE